MSSITIVMKLNRDFAIWIVHNYLEYIRIILISLTRDYTIVSVIYLKSLTLSTLIAPNYPINQHGIVSTPMRDHLIVNLFMGASSSFIEIVSCLMKTKTIIF